MFRPDPLKLFAHKYKNNNSNEPPKKIDCSTINPFLFREEYTACRHYNSSEYCFEMYKCLFQSKQSK